jgi:DNA-binding transcriptional regulator YiaG
MISHPTDEEILVTTDAAPTLKERLTDWIELNPLRKWRHRQELSMMDASALLGCGMSSVQHWEQGAYYPSDDSIDKLAGAMQVQGDTLARSWKQWYAKKPKVGGTDV